MQFSKWHGCGNDFIIVNGFKENFDQNRVRAVEICDRHFGIGGDGLVFVLPSSKADFLMKIINSDGSEAEMCGNVTRCVARYVYESGLTTQTKITLETLAGLIKPELLMKNGKVISVKVDMGEPRLKRGEIPMTGDAETQAVDIPLEIGGVTYAMTAVSMGNPHCVIFVDNLDAVVLEKIGPMIETHPLFPRKTNVEFVQVIDKKQLKMRVWERGAGITLACGTGACASLVAAVLTGRTERKANVQVDGGDLAIEWGSDNHIYKTGPAEEVFTGKYVKK